MKKKYSLLFAVLIATVSFAQHQMQGILNNSINQTILNKSFNRSNLRANNGNTVNNTNSLNQGWFNYGRAIELYNSNSSNLNFSYLFPDSMGYVNSGGALYPMGIHQLAELVDFRSPIFSGNPSTAWVGANPTNVFKIDSMSIVYGYTRQHPNPNIVDTLIVTVYDNQTGANLSNNYLTGTAAANYNTDTVTYKNIGYNQSGNFIAAPTVTTSAQVAPVGQYKFKILLTIADTAIAAFREKAFALPAAFNSVGGKLVVGNVMFKPGYTYTLTQQIDVTANNFIFTSLEENGQFSYPNYLDCNYGSNLCDYSCSYILRKDVRYNMAGNRNYRFSPSYAFISAYTLEHHLISFHLVDTTTLALTTSQQNVTCSGLNNGVASVSVTSGTPPYAFNWNTSPAQTTQTITGLATGTYTCIVTDAAANSGTTSVTIQAQIPFITSANSHLINSGASVNFALTANVPCTFSWLAANNSNVTGESLTTQTLSTINDILINTSSVTTGVLYTIIPTPTSGTCAGVPHSLIVAVNPPIISSGPCSGITTNTISLPIVESFSATAFPPSNWIIMAQNNNPTTWQRSVAAGSQATNSSALFPAYSVNINQGETHDLILPLTSFVNISNPLLMFDVAYAQYINENDKLEVMISTDCGLNWTSVYNKAGSNLMTAAPTTSDFIPTTIEWRADTINLAAYSGISTVLIKFKATSDYGNNIYVDQINLINNTAQLLVNTSQQNITCNGFNNGVASVSITSGTPPYTYTWNTSPAQTTQTITGLPAGTYSCVVNDAAANTATASVNITEPDPIYNVTANIITNGSCVGNASGSAQVSTPMGGTPPYTYMWSTSPPQTTQIVSALANGTYTATVKDSLNCSAQVIVTISPINTITPPFYDSIQGASCSISQNGFIELYNGSIITINGNLPFISEFYNGAGNDKAVEIFNPTNNVIDLNSFSYSSYNWVGSLINQSNATYTFPAGSLVQPYGTFVVAHPLANASILLIANATSSVIDGTSLSLNATTSFFGTQLVDNAYITTTQTNRRKLTINGPNAILTPTEWLSYPLTLANLGTITTSTITTYYEANTIIQWDVNANNQTGPSAFNLKAGTYGYTITDTITGCQYANQVIVPSLGLDQFNVNFSANQTLFTAPPFVAQFTNTTPNLSNYNFVWDFGDGTILSSNNASVFHQYQYNGLYTVKLIATAISTLCKDTMIKTDYIFCTGGLSCNLTASITPTVSPANCAGNNILLTCINSGSITYQWYLNGTAISGATSNTYTASQSGNYQVAITNTVCTDFSNQVTLTFNAPPQAPVITSTGNVTQCLGGSVVLNASLGYSSYLWSTGSTSQSISVSGSGIYSVTGNNSFGCGTTSQPYLLNFSAAPATPICLVTVDTTSLYNQVIWDKPTTTAIDSFKIYRETMTNVFSYLNSVAYDSLSIYNDFAANPNVTSYKYKISAIDTCGNETLLSNYHNTIHLQYLGAGNLQWTVYSIENELNPVLYYMVLRDDNSSGNFLPISSTIPGGNSSFTDINFSSYPNAAYRVDVVWNRTCVPAKLISTSTSISRSNVKHVQAPTNLGQIDLSKFVYVYPNPATFSINVRINTSFITNAIIELYDATGKLIAQQKVSNEYSSLNISEFANGIYTVRVLTDNEQTIKRIVKQQ